MRARENPFRTERIGGLAFRHPTLPVEAIHARWHALGRRAAIVGPKGSGKTTLLRALGARLEEEGLRAHRWSLNADDPLPATRGLVREARSLGPRDVLVFDGAGHLGAAAWWRVARACRGAAGLLVTAHSDGRLETLVQTRTDRALLARLVRELTGASAPVFEPILDDLWAAHGGNLRDVFLSLYDLMARDDPRVSGAPGRRC